jgi:hypothetical protein
MHRSYHSPSIFTRGSALTRVLVQLLEPHLFSPQASERSSLRSSTMSSPSLSPRSPLEIEPSFNIDAMTKLLGLPGSVHRHVSSAVDEVRAMIHLLLNEIPPGEAPADLQLGDVNIMLRTLEYMQQYTTTLNERVNAYLDLSNESSPTFKYMHSPSRPAAPGSPASPRSPMAFLSRSPLRSPAGVVSPRSAEAAARASERAGDVPSGGLATRMHLRLAGTSTSPSAPTTTAAHDPAPAPASRRAVALRRPRARSRPLSRWLLP